MVSWLGSLPRASAWAAGQNLADPNTWKCSSLTTLKQLHDKMLTHYRCIEWAPPPAADAPGQMGRPWTTAESAAMRRAPRRQSRNRTMLPSSISSSVSPTTLHCLLSRMCNALVSCMMMILLLFLQKQNLASAIYLFGLDTLMGGDCAWDHIDSCNRQSANWSIAHEHVLQALERICQAASYATSHKRMLPSEGNRRADLEVRNVHTRRSGSPQQVAGDGGVFGLIVTTSPR